MHRTLLPALDTTNLAAKAGPFMKDSSPKAKARVGTSNTLVGCCLGMFGRPTSRASLPAPWMRAASASANVGGISRWEQHHVRQVATEWWVAFSGSHAVLSRELRSANFSLTNTLGPPASTTATSGTAQIGAINGKRPRSTSTSTSFGAKKVIDGIPKNAVHFRLEVHSVTPEPSERKFSALPHTVF